MKIKKGIKFRHLTNDIEVIERYDNLLLAKIQPDFGPAYFDISTIKLDGSGGEHFDPSYFGNGLTETLPGAPKVPKSLEEMRLQFDNLVAAAMKREISSAEARDAAEAREREFVAKRRKGQEAKDHRKALNDQLKALVATATDLKDFTTSKKVKKIAEEIYITELFIANI